MDHQESLAAVIDLFRGQDKPERALILLQDRSAAMVLSLWSLIPRDLAAPPADRPEAEADLWDWLWRSVTFDMDDLARRAGIDRLCAEVKFEQLRALRLIYPDGSVSGWASRILAKQVVEYLAT